MNGGRRNQKIDWHIKWLEIVEGVRTCELRSGPSFYEARLNVSVVNDILEEGTYGLEIRNWKCNRSLIGSTIAVDCFGFRPIYNNNNYKNSNIAAQFLTIFRGKTAIYYHKGE